MKALALTAALSFFGQAIAAQQFSPRPESGTHAVRPITTADDAQPPRGSSASQPEKDHPVPITPSDCDVQVAKVATVHLLGKLVAPGECGAPDAVALDSVILPDGGEVTVAPPATLRCTMAIAVAQWVREDVAPAAAKLGAPLRGLENLASFDCRTRDNLPGARLSEHGRANALDVRSFKLGDGRIIVLADPKAPKAFRDAVRLGACARFMTVLGPGSDGYHSQHVHIDLAPRRNNYKICEWNVDTPIARTGGATMPSQTAQPRRAGPLRITPVDVPLPRPRPRIVRKK
ncbi:MAG: extensin family protein [Xanthobacteraceae bacterium]